MFSVYWAQDIEGYGGMFKNKTVYTFERMNLVEQVLYIVNVANREIDFLIFTCYHTAVVKYIFTFGRCSICIK